MVLSSFLSDLHTILPMMHQFSVVRETSEINFFYCGQFVSFIMQLAHCNRVWKRIVPTLYTIIKICSDKSALDSIMIYPGTLTIIICKYSYHLN